MDISVVERKRPRFFYGWWLLGAGTVLLAMQGAFMVYGFNAFFLPLAATLGTSRGALSAAFSFTRLESALLGPIGGYMIDRLGPRTMIYLGFTLLGVGFFLFSRVESLLGFYLVFPLIALGTSWSGFLPVVTAVNHWFSRRRGLATGISSAGVNVGGVLVAVVAIAISTYGWRTTALAIAALSWILGFPLAAMIRHRPQQYGYLPDGDDPEARASSADNEASSMDNAAREEPDFTPWEALKTPAFWVISASHGLSVLVISMVTIHEIPLLVDAGISFETAASVLAFMTGVAVVGRVAGGYLGDKLGMRPVLVTCFFLMSAGVIVLATAQTVGQATIFAVLYGLGYGGKSTNSDSSSGRVLRAQQLRHHNGPLPANYDVRLILWPHNRRGSLRCTGELPDGVHRHSLGQPDRGCTGVLHKQARDPSAQRGCSCGRIDRMDSSLLPVYPPAFTFTLALRFALAPFRPLGFSALSPASSTWRRYCPV